MMIPSSADTPVSCGNQLFMSVDFSMLYECPLWLGSHLKVMTSPAPAGRFMISTSRKNGGFPCPWLWLCIEIPFSARFEGVRFFSVPGVAENPKVTDSPAGID